MVATTSATQNNVQTHDAEKRRKHTVERAKANHLSRQLQMRLQYARLKVDHGWQNQNLNEVENLYFHHSHQRGPQPYPAPSLMATTLRDTASYPNTTSSQSSLSFKLGPSILSRNHANNSPTMESPLSENGLSSIGHTQPAPTHVDPDGQNDPNLLLDSGEMKSFISMEGDAEDTSTTLPTFSRQIASPTPTKSYLTDDPNSTENSTSKSNGVLHRTDTSNSASSSPSSHYNNIPHVNSMNSVDGSFGFSGSSLTYDSFWSSHSASAVSRSFRTPTTSATAVVQDDNVSANGGAAQNTDSTADLTSRQVGTRASRADRRKNGVKATARKG